MEPIDFTTWAWTYTNTLGNPIDIDGRPLAPGESRTFRGSATDSTSGAEQFLDSYNHVMAQLPPGASTNDPSMEKALKQAMEQAQAYNEGQKRVLAIPDAPPSFDPTAQDGPLTHVEEPLDLTGRVSVPSQSATAHMSRASGWPPSELSPKEPLPGQKENRSKDEETQKITGADPVDLFTGEFFLEKVDFTLPSVGFPFAFIRTYKSGRPYFGPFGYNWDHNYNIYLRELTSGRIAVNTGRLQEDLYTDSGDSVLYHAPRGVFATLQRHPTASPYAYVLTFRDGSTWSFARPASWSHPERIPLVAIADRHGNTQQLIYNSNSQLVQVIDTVGRAIDFVYGNCDRLEALRPAFLQTPGAPPVEIKYLHTGDTERLAAVVTFPTPDFPDGLITEYEYDEAQPFGEQRNNITRVIDAKGQAIVENIYGTDPADPAFNRVVKQYFDGGEYLFKYTYLKFVPPYDEHINDAYLQVELYEPERPLKLYTFNFRGNLLDERFRLCADGSYRVWAQAYRYTTNGQLAEHYHPDGMVEVFTYDDTNPDPLARGLLLRIDIKSQPNRLLTRTVQRFTYELRYHRIKTITDEIGETVTFVYDYELDLLAPGGNLVRIEYPDATLPDGTAQMECHTTFRYDARGQLVEQVSPEGRKTTFEYYMTGVGAGLLKSKSRHDGRLAIVELFEYDALGHLARHVDARGSDTILKHNLLGQLAEVQLRVVGGRRASFKFEYNEDRKVVREYTPRGAYSDGIIQDEWIIHEYEYDVASRLRRQTRNVNTVAPQVTSFAHDVHGRIRNVIDPIGRETRFKYDERGLVLGQIRFANDSSPLETTFRYDRTGRLTKARYADGTVEQFDYVESFGRLRSKTNRLGVRKEFSYGPRDELRATSLKDAAGNILQNSQYRYDEKRRLVGYDLNGLAQMFYYDRDDLLARAVDHRGRAVHYAYDDLGRVSAITDPLGTVVRMTLDASSNRIGGRIEYQSTRTGAVVSFEERTGYDARDRLTTFTDRSGNLVQQVFDDRDLRTEVIDALDNRVRTEYDINGLPIRTALVTGGVETTIRCWHRDLVGRPLAFEDADGNLTRYEYDGKNNVILVTYPDGSSLKKTYSPSNVLAFEEDANGSILTYGYNAAGQLTDIDVQPGTGVTATAPLHLSYDAFGRLQRIDNGTHSVERAYDFLNRITEEKQGAVVTKRVYDDAMERVTLIYSDGREDVLHIDDAGRIAAVVFRKKGTDGLVAGEFPEGTPLVQYDYDGILLATSRLANGVMTEYSYDQDGKLIGREVRGPEGVLLDQERRFFDGEKRARLSIRRPHINHHIVYRYDALSRLTDAFTAPGAPNVPAALTRGGADQAEIDAFLAGVNTANALQQEHYVLAVNDRRVSWQQDGVMFTPTYNNLLQLIDLQASNGAGVGFQYDRNGNRIEDGRFRYRYDAFDRLVSVTDKGNGQSVLELSYDPLGRIVERRENGAVTQFVFDGPRAIEELRNGGARTQRAFGAGVDEVLAESSAGANVFCHHDEIGSLRALTDSHGTLLQLMDYSAFGLPSVFDAAGQPLATGTAALAPAFGGRPYLASASLYDLRARFYDPVTGNFLQRDAIDYADSSNQYLYCRHNPVGLGDPNGRLAPVVIGFAAAAALGAGAGAVFGSIRQGLQIATGYTDEYGNVKEEFDWNELGVNVGLGGALGIGIFVFPPLAGGMIALGLAGGLTEVVNGNRLVGAFDIGTSIFGTKGLPKFRGTTVASRFHRLGLDTLISFEGIRLHTNLAFMSVFGFTRSGFHQRRLEAAATALTRTAELRVALERVGQPGLRVNEEFNWRPEFLRDPRQTAGELDVFTRTEIDEIKTGADFMQGLTTTYRTRREHVDQRIGEVEHLGQIDKYGMFFPDHRINLWIRFRYFTDPRNGRTSLHREFEGQLSTLRRHFPYVNVRELTPAHLAPPKVADVSSPLTPLVPMPRLIDGSLDEGKSPSQKN
jgi:RHS repeat-associated protein